LLRGEDDLPGEAVADPAEVLVDHLETGLGLRAGNRLFGIETVADGRDGNDKSDDGKQPEHQRSSAILVAPATYSSDHRLSLGADPSRDGVRWW
jgi:hypothetical protein